MRRNSLALFTPYVKAWLSDHLSPRRGSLGTRQFMVTTWLFAHAHRILKWRPTERQLLKFLVFYFVISAKSYEDSVITWTCALRNGAETTVSTYGSVEIARLEKKERRMKKNNLAVLTNSSLVLPRWLLATLTVLVVTEH